MKVGSTTIGKRASLGDRSAQGSARDGAALLGRSSRSGGDAGTLDRPRWIEVTIYSICIFLLSSPFTFFLIGEDPTVPIQRDVGTLHTESAQTLMYVVRGLALLIAMAGSLRRWRSTIRNLRALWPVLPFTLWAALSIFWSDNASSTIHNVGSWLALALAAYLIGQRLGPGHLARAVIGAGILIAICSLAFVFLLPGYGKHQFNDVTQFVHAGAWRGIYLHKNYFGHVAAFFATATLWVSTRTIPHRWVKWGLFALFVFLDVMSTSASAMIMIVIASVLIWAVMVADGKNQLRALLALGPALILGYYLTGEVFALLHRDKSFSGRDVVWNYAWDAFAQRPIHGWGYVSMTYGDFSYLLGRSSGLSDPHSGYWDVALGTGIIGLALFLLMIVMACRAARQGYKAGGLQRESALALFALMSGWLVSCVTEVSERPLGATAGLGMFGLVCLLSTRRRGAIRRLRLPAPVEDAEPKEA